MMILQLARMLGGQCHPGLGLSLAGPWFGLYLVNSRKPENVQSQ